MPQTRARVQWTPAAVAPLAGGPGLATAPVPSGVERAILSAGVPRIADATTPKEDAIGLLQLAAEVEHALLVQYLYAAASIDPTASPESKKARDAITHVAIQEMGHLVCVQNLLLALDGVDAHHLGRDGMRAISDRNPLPLVLEPVTHAALAKFVTVERPADIADEQLRKRVEKLGEEASKAGHFSPHPVSALYAAIYWIFQPSDSPFGPLAINDPNLRRGWHLKPADFIDGTTIDRLAATSDEWGGFPDLKIFTVRDAATGCNALFEIMAHGEGVPGDAEQSHFEDFLAVLDNFDRITAVALCRTPRVADQPPSEDAMSTTLTQPYTVAWGRLFNIRYTHLIIVIAHALRLPATDPDRGALVGVALQMMRPGLASIMRLLKGMDVDTAGSEKAGPPFGLLDETLPTSEAAYWARHRELLAAQADRVKAIETEPQHAADAAGRLLLKQLGAVDQQLIDLLAAHP